MARPDENMASSLLISYSSLLLFPTCFCNSDCSAILGSLQMFQKAASYLLSHLSHTLVHIILSLAKSTVLAATETTTQLTKLLLQVTLHCVHSQVVGFF